MPTHAIINAFETRSEASASTSWEHVRLAIIAEGVEQHLAAAEAYHRADRTTKEGMGWGPLW